MTELVSHIRSTTSRFSFTAIWGKIRSPLSKTSATSSPDSSSWSFAALSTPSTISNLSSNSSLGLGTTTSSSPEDTQCETSHQENLKSTVDDRSSIFFELCVNGSRTRTSLGEIALSDDRGNHCVKTDMQLFSESLSLRCLTVSDFDDQCQRGFMKNITACTGKVFMLCCTGLLTFILFASAYTVEATRPASTRNRLLYRLQKK